MKKVSVERHKRFAHLIGQEFNEQYVFNPAKKNISFFINPLLMDLDGETSERYEDEFDHIYRCDNGEYVIDDGDFTILIRIEDYLGE